MDIKNHCLYLNNESYLKPVKELNGNIHFDTLTIENITIHQMMHKKFVNAKKFNYHYEIDSIESDESLKNFVADELYLTTEDPSKMVELMGKFKNVKKIIAYVNESRCPVEYPLNTHAIVYSADPQPYCIGFKRYVTFHLNAPVVVFTFGAEKDLVEYCEITFVQHTNLKQVIVKIYKQYDFKFAEKIAAAVSVPVLLTTKNKY